MAYTYFLPRGSVTRKEVVDSDGKVTIKSVVNFPPNLQCSFDGRSTYCFIIPRLARDEIIECVGKDECFFYINRGYFCKKHART